MLRMNKDNSDYEIDRELTWKFAIEKNAEYQEKIEQLEEENKKLKERVSELEDVSKDYDLLSKDFIALWEENKKLKEKLDKLQDEYDELYIEKCNASNQWKCCEAENKELKEDVDYFRQCYLDLKKLCEKEWFMLSDEEVTKMFNLDEIK